MTRAVGRDAEFEILRRHLDDAVSGRGSTVFVSGEAGIGKSLLVEEFAAEVEADGLRLVKGMTQEDNPRPFLVFSDALDEHLDRPIFSESEFTGFGAVFLVNAAGLVVAEASAGGTGGLDPDIFAGMLTAVQNFVRDSLDGVGKSGSGLGKLQYGDLSILIEHGENLFLAAVVPGAEHPEMRGLLKRTLARIIEEHSDKLAGWSGEASAVGDVADIVRGLPEARFQVRRDPEKVNLVNERLRISAVVLDAIISLSEERGLVLLLEDLHWADVSSFFVLDFLARNVRDRRILLIGTCRPGENEGLDGLRARLSGDEAAESVAVGLLGPADVQNLIDSMFEPNSFPPKFTSDVASETGGNPFFIVEVLRHMHSLGAIELRDGTYVLGQNDYSLPGSVDDFVHAKLGSLEPEHLAMVELVACIGLSFERNIAVAGAAGKDPDRLLGGLAEAGLLRLDNGNTSFTHAIFRSAIYESLTQRWKTAHHRTLGEVYEREYAGRWDEVIYELARHFFLGSVHQKAMDYCYAAAADAEAKYAFEQSLVLYRQALDSISLVRMREAYSALEYDIGMKMAKLRSFLGQNADGVAIYEELLGSEDADVVDIHTQIARVYSSMANYDKVIEHCGLALEELGDDMSVRHARVHNTMYSAYLSRKDFRKCGELLEMSLAISEKAGDEKMIAIAHHNLGIVNWFNLELDAAEEHFRKAIALKSDIDDESSRLSSVGNLAGVLFSKGDVRAAREKWLEAMLFFRKTNYMVGLVATLSNLGEAANVLDEHDDALRYLEESDVFAKRMGNFTLTINNDVIRSRLYIKTGDLDSAEVCARRALESAGRYGPEYKKYWGHIALANVLREKGDWGGAEEHYGLTERHLSEAGDENGLAQIDFERGVMMKRRGKSGDARTLFASALERYSADQEERWVADCRKELADLRDVDG